MKGQIAAKDAFSPARFWPAELEDESFLLVTDKDKNAAKVLLSENLKCQRIIELSELRKEDLKESSNIVFLSSQLSSIEEGSIPLLLRQAARRDVALAAAKELLPSGRVAACGYVRGEKNRLWPLHSGIAGFHPGYFALASTPSFQSFPGLHCFALGKEGLKQLESLLEQPAFQTKVRELAVELSARLTASASKALYEPQAVVSLQGAQISTLTGELGPQLFQHPSLGLERGSFFYKF